MKKYLHYLKRSIQILKVKGWVGLADTVVARWKRQRGDFNYNIAPTAWQVNSAKSALLPLENHQRLTTSLLSDELVIITGVPFDDVGGGQRAAQLARCGLKTGQRVIYIYLFEKFDFELNQYVKSAVNLTNLLHLHIDETTPQELLKNISSHATLVIELPHIAALPFLQLFNQRGMRTVFEMIDEWDTSLGGSWFNIDTYNCFVAQAQLVTGTAKLLVQKLIKAGRTDAIYLPNAANEYIFDKYKTYARPRDLPRGERVGLYFGSLYGEWFAWDYLFAAAASNPSYVFVLIGDKPNEKNGTNNIIFLGSKKIEELPAYISHADFGLLPFSPGKISDAVSPIKVFEYLFAGKPVVATRLPEILDYSHVYTGNSPDEFALLCQQVKVNQSFDALNDRFVSENSWFSRLDTLTDRTQRTKFKNCVSAIILIHNNRNIIDRCLKSLINHANAYLKEIIIVDNASSDGGAEYVEQAFPNVIVLRNLSNGCSSGRNMAVQKSTGQYLAFFDSDQWFTSSSSFEEALSILERNSLAGAVGWAAGWFDPSRSDLGGMITDYCPNRAMNHEAMARGYRSDVGYLGTGGMFLPRSVFSATSGFDTAYDPTCFEDTDISFQIKCLGFEICYRDLTGIRHQPHQTTMASSNSDFYNQLFQRNAEYFRKKWAQHSDLLLDYSG
jgi:GT2 family glycosyltransferase/glycosyltransferase involved in cell wall biosynthesis